MNLDDGEAEVITERSRKFVKRLVLHQTQKTQKPKSPQNSVLNSQKLRKDFTKLPSKDFYNSQSLPVNLATSSAVC